VRFLRIVAGSARRTSLFPEFFPVPDSIGYIVGEWKSNLVREHADLAAVVGFVGKYVAEHFHADRPRLSPAVSVKRLDTA